MLWADSDPIIPLRSATGSPRRSPPAPTVIENASHFLQEDAGEEIGEKIAAWLRA